MANVPTMRDAVLSKVHGAMSRQRDVFFLSADFGAPILDRIREEFPDRFINVGIAEQNLINVASGLSLEGFRVIAYAIAPFITMRCFEQIRVNLALLSEVRQLNVTLIGVGAGYSYVVSGPTHQCYEDITLMRALPNLTVLSPADYRTAEALVPQCLSGYGVSYLRLDAQLLPAIPCDTLTLAGGFRVLAPGDEVCIVATGYMVHAALRTRELLTHSGISTMVVDAFNLSSLDGPGLLALLSQSKYVVTMEEGFVGSGGLDALVRGLCSDGGVSAPVKSFGIPRRYQFDLGSREQLHETIGMSPDKLCSGIQEFIIQRDTVR